MKRNLLSILFLFSGLLLFAQQKEYATELDIPYYESSIIKNDKYIAERCMLDVYYPKNTQNAPTVVWFHGGGLSGGSKSIPKELMEKGICVVAVNYRLYPKVTAIQCLEDAAASVAWVFNNISKYNGNPSLIFVSGHSAGGYLASMIGLDKKWLMKHHIDANKIAGIIPFSGHTITHFAIRNEKGIPDYQPVVDEFAPLYHVRKDAPPMLLITGDRELEMLGRYEENAYLMRMMKIAGHNDIKLYELDGYGHNMAEPAFPLLINEINRIVNKLKIEG